MLSACQNLPLFASNHRLLLLEPLKTVSTYFRSHEPERPLASTQVAHLHCTVIVRCNEASQSVRDAFPTFLIQALNNFLNGTFTVFLLVRQQLERIDQVFTKCWRNRVRPERKPSLHLRMCRAAPPESCWVLSIQIFLHRLHTTSCSVSSPSIPTK